MEKKDIHLKGGSKFAFDASFIIGIQRTPAERQNSKIKIIKAKYNPNGREEI